MSMKVKVKIENLHQEVEAEVGQNLRQALGDHDIKIYKGIDSLANCRGLGLCGTCQIEVVEGEGLNDESLYEKIRIKVAQLMGMASKGDHRRLACQTRIYQDVVIRTLITPPSHE